ncbi:MAG: M20/M25/M40 family metallo-hydrolase [Bryobacterales bacterium]|nr:M20/M25/M40 family metallo-hydrolase [Bryobacterales bacterium]
MITKEEEAADAAVQEHLPYLVRILQELVRTPSENRPPFGNEGPCQEKFASCLAELDVRPDMYQVDSVPGLDSHPLYRPGRDYAGRTNVNGVLRGVGGGRSLVLSGHMDTVPAHTPMEWRHAPFGAEITGGCLYGRGAWDMKAGIAMNLAVVRALRQSGVRLAGDLIVESVADEEFGGVNGTLAARLRGYLADGAVIGEPTSLRICPAQRGGRIVHIELFGDGGILQGGAAAAGIAEQLAYLLRRFHILSERRRSRVLLDPYYAYCTNPFAVSVTNVSTGEWGWTQPIAVAERCRIEIAWQAMPSEPEAEVEAEFRAWWRETIGNRPDLFGSEPRVESPIAWIPGCAISPDSPLVQEFARSAESVGLTPPIEGLDAPSDMYIFQLGFGIPAIMWGPAGGRAHQADEFVELDSLLRATRALMRFVLRWCKVAS